MAVDFVRVHASKQTNGKGRPRIVSCYVRADAICLLWRDHPDSRWQVTLSVPPAGFESRGSDGIYFIGDDAFRKLTGADPRELATEARGRVEWIMGPSSEQWVHAVQQAHRDPGPDDANVRRVFMNWADMDWGVRS